MTLEVSAFCPNAPIMIVVGTCESAITVCAGACATATRALSMYSRACRPDVVLCRSCTDHTDPMTNAPTRPAAASRPTWVPAGIAVRLRMSGWPVGGRNARPRQMTRTPSASETYRVSSASAPALRTSTRPSTTGVTSAATSQPARIAHARQAYRRSAMLARMTATATITASQASMPGGADAAYCASSMGNHCHGPPSAPGTNVFFSSPQVKLNVWPTPETVGCAVDVCSD